MKIGSKEWNQYMETRYGQLNDHPVIKAMYEGNVEKVKKLLKENNMSSRTLLTLAINEPLPNATVDPSRTLLDLPFLNIPFSKENQELVRTISKFCCDPEIEKQDEEITKMKRELSDKHNAKMIEALKNSSLIREEEK